MDYYWKHSEATRQAVQEAVDWIFPWGYQWFGRPDNQKSMTDQLVFGVRNWTNDTMRDKWLQSACTFAKRLGFKVPAHYDEELGKFVVDDDYPAPMLADNDTHEWIWEAITWDEMIQYWKGGGPMRPGAYERLQREEWGSALW